MDTEKELKIMGEIKDMNEKLLTLSYLFLMHLERDHYKDVSKFVNAETYKGYLAFKKRGLYQKAPQDSAGTQELEKDNADEPTVAQE